MTRRGPLSTGRDDFCPQPEQRAEGVVRSCPAVNVSSTGPLPLSSALFACSPTWREWELESRPAPEGVGGPVFLGLVLPVGGRVFATEALCAM